MTCVLCDQLDETTDHLLCACVFSREIWSWLLHSLRSIVAPPLQDSTVLDWWLSSKPALPKELRRSFYSLVLLVSRCLWNELNRRTFDRKTRSTTEVLHHILEEAGA
jgi:hypothetical protein